MFEAHKVREAQRNDHSRRDSWEKRPHHEKDSKHGSKLSLELLSQFSHSVAQVGVDMKCVLLNFLFGFSRIA